MRKENVRENLEQVDNNSQETDKILYRFVNFSKRLGRVLTNPGMLLSVLRFQKLDHVYEC